MSAIPHIEFIVASYAVAGVVILGMVVKIVWDYRGLGAELAALEAARGEKDASK